MKVGLANVAQALGCTVSENELLGFAGSAQPTALNAGVDAEVLALRATNTARAEIIAEARATSAMLREKYGAMTSAERMARIDELAGSNYNRLLAQDLSNQEFVYRLVKSSDLRHYEAAGAISGRAGSPTYFALDTADSIPAHMLGAQMKPAGYDTVLRIPVTELVNPAVPRPFGYAPVSSRPNVGWEYFTNSYPEFGSGGFRQFEATTRSYSPAWIVQQ